MANDSFDFYVGGIEHGILAVLKDVMRGYGVVDTALLAKKVKFYEGELDDTEFARDERSGARQATAHITPLLPAFLVGYGESTGDKKFPAEATLRGESVPLRFDCSFGVVACALDWDGRRGNMGARKMLSDSLDALAGMYFEVAVENEDDPVVLNVSPLLPSADSPRFIARLPELTAYAWSFETSILYDTPNRSTKRPISEIDLTIQSVDAPVPRIYLPGIHSRDERY